MRDSDYGDDYSGSATYSGYGGSNLVAVDDSDGSDSVHEDSIAGMTGGRRGSTFQ